MEMAVHTLCSVQCGALCQVEVSLTFLPISRLHTPETQQVFLKQTSPVKNVNIFGLDANITQGDTPSKIFIDFSSKQSKNILQVQNC
jgi:hypothetical protein